jgi:hypothetical protein
MTALARVSLTGSYETTLERFKEESGTTSDTGSPTYAMLATDRNWTTAQSTVTLSGGTISLTDGAACRLLTTCRKYAYVGAYDVPVVNGLFGLHIQTSGGGCTLYVDMKGTVYDGWSGQSKILRPGPVTTARLWLTDPSASGRVSDGFGQLYSTSAGMTWVSGHYTSPFAVFQAIAGDSALNATAGYTCNATAGVSIKSGYVNQYGTSATTISTPDTAFDNGLMPLMKLTITGTIATYSNEEIDYVPASPGELAGPAYGDCWPGDGTYYLWQVNRTTWKWVDTPNSYPTDNPYDPGNPSAATREKFIEVSMTGPDGGGKYTLSVSGDGFARFKLENIASGSLDGQSLSALDIPRTSDQDNIPADHSDPPGSYQDSAVCTMDSG